MRTLRTPRAASARLVRRCGLYRIRGRRRRVGSSNETQQRTNAPHWQVAGIGRHVGMGVRRPRFVRVVVGDVRTTVRRHTDRYGVDVGSVRDAAGQSIGRVEIERAKK